METHHIEKRYGTLSTSDCCLSCGGAAELAQAESGEICLDLGSGRGTEALRLVEDVGPDGFVWGIDISDGMLEKARATASKLGVKNVRFEKAELESLPLPSASIDLVVSNCVLNHAADKARVWSEIFRVLKPGGRFVVSDIYSTEPVPEAFRTDPEAVAECWAGADTRAVYLCTLAEAGFPETNILEESAPYTKGRIEVASFTLTGRKPDAPKPNVRECCCNG